ncbi:MAG TPA: DEAD/DEAH box helicase family protein [Clostridiaceae bacterium]
MKDASELIKVESDLTFESLALKEIVATTNCITGDRDHFIYYLKEAFKKAKTIDIIVAFLMESGVRLLEEDLKLIKEMNIPIRILTGNYLNITQPQALYLMKDILGDQVDLRFYNEPHRSFHPKAYIVEYEKGGDIFVGSSNISRSALTSGIEWNYRLEKEKNHEDYDSFKDTFEELFLNHSKIIDETEMKKYSESWKRPKVYYDIEKNEEAQNNVIELIRPKGAQIEALYELKKARAEGLDKVIVVAATGVGKTYLGAFDSIEFKKILFVAHREEILKQAEATFKIIRPKDKTGIFNGIEKNKDKNILFASVQTLGQNQYLKEEYFKKDEFDYIIMDEFHHAVAGNYQNILDYFTPKFLLGLTATPERLDNKDVFALCDYNVVYELRLKAAIDKGWLVPFRYYGVYDETNYENITYKNGKYDEKSLEAALMINKRAEVILKHYEKYRSERALGFCTSRAHSEYMAKYFCGNDVKACAVYSGPGKEFSLERKEALQKLNKGEIKVIFSVDMFNEGLDVPAVDLVMFLRPTESPTVFLQQLGRGLRKSIGKEYLNVLDFIGNYKKANLIPFFLTGNIKDYSSKTKAMINPKPEDYPQDCMVDFDFRIVDIFKRQAEAEKKFTELKDIVIKGAQLSVPRFVIEEYYRIKEYVQERPSRLQFYTYFDDELYKLLNSNNKVLKDYLWFLKEIGETTVEENELVGTIAHEFIKMVENTAMSKSYKMPIFLAFYNQGILKFNLTEEDIYHSFKAFYDKGSNYIDLTQHKSGEDYKAWGKKQYVSLAKKNPENFLLQSASEFFYKDNDSFCLNLLLKNFCDNAYFIKQFKDGIDYRTRKYYKERLENKSEGL